MASSATDMTARADVRSRWSLADFIAPDTIDRGSRGGGWASLPDRIVLITVSVFLVASACAIFRIMHWWVFAPVLALVLILGWRFLPQPVARTRSMRNGAVVAVGFAVLWLLIQAPFASQYFAAIRDPGIYLLSAAVIAHTGGSPIDIRGAHSLVEAVPGLIDALGAFGSANNVDIQLQGSTGVPAVIAIGYWIAGVQGAILVNLVIGAVCLIAVYGLARRLVGPWWALLPVVLLSVAMPFVYLSRTTYTEIMATLIVVAAATWTLSAFSSRRTADFWLAGAIAGAAGLTRVDGALSYEGALLGAILIVVGVGRRETDLDLRRPLLAFAAGGSALLALGVFDLYFNEHRYVDDLGSIPKQLWLAAVILTVVLVAAVFTRLGTSHFQLGRQARTIALWGAWLLAATFVFWISRPAWLVYHDTSAAPYQRAIAGLQAQDGLPLDPTRSYDEYSLAWFGWYFGWPFVAAAAVGLCLWVYWAVSRRSAAQTMILATAALVALLYLDSIKVTPDQIWAFRRVLPVITTTLVIAAALLVRWLWQRGKWMRRVAGATIVACLVGVALPWGHIFFTVEGSGQAAEIARICETTHGAKVVAYVAQGAPPNYALTVRTVCDVQTVVIEDVSTFDWVKLDEEAKGPVAVVAFRPELVPWVSIPEKPTAVTTMRMWTRHLLSTPRTTSLTVRSVYTGKLGSDGRVTFSQWGSKNG